MWLEIVETLALIPTFLLLILLILQYALLIFKKEKNVQGSYRPSISILIPVHNEERHIKKTINSILECGYSGKREIIVINDGSTDNTPNILKEFERKGLIKLITTKHLGKANALNKGLKIAKNEVIVTIDGDTMIEKGSLEKLVAPLKGDRVVATTGVIKVANLGSPLTWFQRVEYLYLSLYKSICDKIDGMIWASGTLSAFKSSWLKKVRFNPNLYMEDVDIGLKIIKQGYKIRYVKDAVAYTFCPEKLKDFVKQRIRWVRGGIQIIKKYASMFFNREYFSIGFFTLPIMSYWYFHALTMGTLLFLQIFLGYYSFYYIYGNIISLEVVKYFFYWFSLFGVINLIYQIAIGNFQLKLLYVLNILLVALMYGIYIYALKWHREKIKITDVIAYIFMFPYWLLILVVQNFGNIEWFKKKGRNWWRK
jgi:cellulose synthase/poly-beta-1,6-N-acetylglucosamine synthase-like glycosyltransferase